MLSSREAARLLLAIAGASFASNVLSAWLEQVLFRFPIHEVGHPVRRLLAVEVGVTFLFLPPLVLALRVRVFQDPAMPLGFALLLTGLVASDTVYRLAIVPLQLAGRDRHFITLNLLRATAEITFAAAAMFALPTAEATMGALVLARTAISAWAYASSPLSSHGGKPVEKPAWPAYGAGIGLWLIALQGLSTAPQLLSSSYLSLADSAAFVASFRLFTQVGLLGTGMALLYYHPLLMRALQQRGREDFLEEWRAGFVRYCAVTFGFAIGMAGVFPFVAPLLLTRSYAQYSLVVVLALPGILFWALANYVQKVLEAEGQVFAMAGYLLIACGFFVVLLAGSWAVGLLQQDLPRTSCLAFSVALGTYSTLVAKRAHGSVPRAQVSCRRILGGLATGSLVLTVVLVVLLAV
jgi:hypothetical protein